MEKARAHVFIDGNVQGVFYRSFTRDQALDLGLKGWVRNLGDGRVEAVFEGDKEIIERAIKGCYVGPPGAQVSHIDVQWEPYEEEEKGFSVRH